MTQQWFQKNEQYTDDSALGGFAWDDTLGLVRVVGDGKTNSGWGRERFGRNFKIGRFRPSRIVRDFESDQYPFAFIMRTLPMLVVDIDGKNGGLESSSILGLTETLAERSKSGNGYHLFYTVEESEWNNEYGYDEYPDVNALIPGVDIRATGCVYHYEGQLWNNWQPAQLPNSVRRLMDQRREQAIIERKKREEDANLEPEDLAIEQERALRRLAAPVGEGSRNQKMFAVGSQLQRYGVKDWEQHLETRALMLGLEADEVRRLIRHIKKY